jgi:hypothetical protein
MTVSFKNSSTFSRTVGKIHEVLPKYSHDTANVWSSHTQYSIYDHRGYLYICFYKWLLFLIERENISRFVAKRQRKELNEYSTQSRDINNAG